MQIDREFIEGTISNLRTQAEQISGALLLAQEFLKRLEVKEEPAMTMPELQEAINRGAESGGSE